MANPLQGLTKVLSNAKTRMIVIILLVIAILGISIGVVRKTSTATLGGGHAELAGVPRSIRSVPGSSVQNDQYLQTLLQANQQAAQQALSKGTTEVATLVAAPQASTGSNYNAQMLQTGSNCSSCNCCCNQSGATGAAGAGDAGTTIASLQAQGKISPVLASQLQALEAQNLSPDDYAAKIQELVREGKLSPDVAQQLIAAYQKTHGGAASVANPDDAVDQLLANGNITSDTAAALKQLNHEGLTPEEYAARLNELVKEGKLTPEQAQQLMHAYQQAHGGADNQKNAADAAVNKLLASGAVDPATAEQLKALNQQDLTPAEYAQHLNELVKEGKLTPEQARALLNAYNQQHAAQLADQTPDDVANKLLSKGGIDSATADELKNINAQNLSPDDYAAKLQQLVAEGKLTPEQAQELLAAYKRQHATNNGAAKGGINDAIDQLSSSGALSPDVANQLKTLSSGQLTPDQYRQEVERLVAEGKLSPTQARQLLDAYNAQFAGQQSAIDNTQSQQSADTTEQQAVANQQVAQAMQAAVENQAKQLIAAWNAPSQNVVGTLVDLPEKDSASSQTSTASGQSTSASGSTSQASSKTAPVQAPSVHAGDIVFAVLNTAVNSDQPGPVMATIVNGQYKGAKLLGGLTVTPDSEGVVLQFNSITMPSWNNSVAITAYAIDPDTARTALASDVNHHYLTRFGSVFAAAFMQGIGNAVLQSGSTSVNNAGTTSSTYQKMDTKDQILVGLGQVGQSIGTYAQQGMNRKPTVTVNSGTGLGILFMKDVVLPNANSNQ